MKEKNNKYVRCVICGVMNLKGTRCLCGGIDYEI